MNFVKAFLFTFSLMVGLNVSATPVMPDCTIDSHIKEVQETLKSLVLFELNKYFTDNQLTTEPYDLYTSVQKYDPWKQYHLVYVREDIQLNPGPKIAVYFNMWPGVGHLRGRVAADKVMPDGTLVNGRCEVGIDASVAMMNMTTNVIVHEFRVPRFTAYNL